MHLGACTCVPGYEMPIVATCIIKWSPLTTLTFVRFWSACTVKDKWATTEHGPPYHDISLPDCYVAAISTIGRSALPKGAGLGSRCTAGGIQAEAIRTEQVGNRRHYMLSGWLREK